MSQNGRPTGALSSNLQRRELLKLMGMGGAAMATGLGLSGQAFAQDANLAFWASGTLDIGENWSQMTADTGLSQTFTDNGNDMGPVVARLAAGNANELFDIGGFQGGAEKELARQGQIVPWDISKIPNYEQVWQWARDIPYLQSEGKQYGLPTVVNADSIIYRKDKLGFVDSYGVIFDPKLKGRVAMEDAWINSAVFAAIYLKEAESQPIGDPGNLTESELGLVMEFLIKHKSDGQFRTFWNGWEQGVQLVADEEVDAMTGWEPIVYEGRKRGLDGNMQRQSKAMKAGATTRSCCAARRSAASPMPPTPSPTGCSTAITAARWRRPAAISCHPLLRSPLLRPATAPLMRTPSRRRPSMSLPSSPARSTGRTCAPIISSSTKSGGRSCAMPD